jgi:hypothetical protein
VPPAVEPEKAISGRYRNPIAPIALAPESDLRGAAGPELTKEEAAHFREFGFVVKRGLIPAAELEPIVDLIWAQRPITEAGVVRDDPATWVAPGERWPPSEPFGPAGNRWGTHSNWMGKVQSWPGPEDARPGARRGERIGRLPFKLDHVDGASIWRWHGIHHDDEYLAATSRHPNVLRVVEALLGGPLKRPNQNRGVYSLFPRPAGGAAGGGARAPGQSAGARLGPHCDGHPTEVMAATYLRPVGPRSGGFTIWPRSPQLLYPTSAQAVNMVPTERTAPAIERILDEVAPAEFVGGAGDTVFCHGFMLHSGGIHEGEQVRMAVIHDFVKLRERGHVRWMAAGKGGGPRVNCDMNGVFDFSGEPAAAAADGEREVTVQWMIETSEWNMDVSPPHDDMFRDWNLGRRAPAGDVVTEPPWWEKYELPMQPPGSSGHAPRGCGALPAVPLSSIARYEGGGIWRAVHRGNEWRAGGGV